MDRLDREILRREEQCVLQLILFSLEQSEAVERARAKPSVVTHVVIVGPSRQEENDTKGSGCLPTRKKNRTLSGRAHVYEDVVTKEKAIIPTFLDDQGNPRRLRLLGVALPQGRHGARGLVSLLILRPNQLNHGTGVEVRQGRPRGRISS
jgi:hypothetical protein